MGPNRLIWKGSAVVAAALLASAGLAACGGSSGSSSSKTVTIWTSVDTPVLDGLEKKLDPEASKMGITVKWSDVSDINQIIMTKLQAGDAPDIAMIPQPGVVDQIVSSNDATPLDGILDMSSLQKSMTAGTLAAGTVNGKLYGLLVSMNVKSLVFYPKKAWDAAGYKVPNSIAALNALTDQIKSDGGVPWCFGIESGSATGWPATDWFEDLIMRYGSPTQYEDWVTHKIPFESNLVKQAAAEFEKLMFTSGNVYGGQSAIASINFENADDPMWTTKPGCWMLKQGNFITAFFPSAVQKALNTDVGVFPFPPLKAGGPNPVLGGGDMATLLNDNASSEAVMKLLSQTDVGDDAAPAGDFLSPHKDFNMSLYPNDIVKAAAKTAYTASTLLFDGSDAMPAQVGSGTFWTEMTSWISGNESLDTALKNIDDSWPSS